MPNLAGFDLIIEVARMAIERELLNTPYASQPNRPQDDTLVPPFILTRSVPLPGLSGVLNLKVTALKLRAHPGSSLVTLDMSFEECSLQAPGIDVRQLAGSASVTAPLSFAPPAGTPPSSTLVLDFNQATSSLTLDPPSSNQLDQSVGPALGGAIRSALNTALTALFKSQGVANLNFSFAVDSSRDSTNMMTLTAVPALSWIDGETLAIFGYHRKGANTGSVVSKHTSDLPPAPYPGFPWYPIATLLSASSFHQLIACPAIWGAARDHVSGRHRTAWIDEERAHHHNEGPATPEEIAAADNRLRLYLDSPEGRAETEGCFPAPCGHGQIDQRIKMPDPFSDTTGYVNWLSMDLGEGRVEMKAKAHADVFCASVAVEVPMSLQPFIGGGNSIQAGPITKGQPSSDVDADLLCDVAVGVLMSFLLGPLVGSIIAIVGVNVAESLAEGLINSEILKKGLPAPNASSSGPALPAGVRLKTLDIAPSGLTIQGVWDGMVIDPHKLNPAVHLYWSTKHSISNQVLTLPGLFQASCGGDPRNFKYYPSAWDTTVIFTLDIGDVPRPIQYGDWYFWHDGVVHTLAPGTLTFPGQVVVPVPPNQEVLQSRDEIVVGVEGSNEQGYTLTFRAEDDNVPFALETRLVDGSGRGWPLWTNNLYSQGLTFSFDQEYIDFREECARHMKDVIDGYKLVHDVPVWDKVTAYEAVLQEGLRGVLHGQVLGAAEMVRQLMAEQPEIANQLFAQ